MKVTRVLNNNVVLGEEDRIQYLLMGLSIGYKHRVGSIVPSSAIEKMFVLKSPKYVDKIQEMLKFIPDEYFSFTSDAITYIKKELKQDINDSLFIILTDHIHACIERYKKGIVLRNGLLNEVKKFYSQEFNVALHIVEMMNNQFNVGLDENEAAFIAFNIINAQSESESGTVLEMTRLIQEIIDLIQSKYDVKFNEEDEAYVRFVTHLKYYCHKVFLKKKDTFIDKDMINLVKNKYPDEYAKGLEIVNLVKSKYDYNGSEMDAIYLAIHIARILNGYNH